MLLEWSKGLITCDGGSNLSTKVSGKYAGCSFGTVIKQLEDYPRREGGEEKGSNWKEPETVKTQARHAMDSPCRYQHRY